MPPSIGRYRVDRPLGSGAFASVWLGFDDALDAPVAIKVLSGSLIDDLDVRSRFLEEARILRRADSERLISVHDMGELPDKRPFFVMSYADRGTLADRLGDEPLPIEEALRLAEETALGVAVVNTLGIIHRDLKPSNVLFQSAPTGGERVVIADLGLAKALAHASGVFTLPVGTPGYMSPEQAESGGGLDVRADVYGLGALAYHLITGRPPGPAPVRVPPSQVRLEVPDAADRVIMRALEMDRDRRWPDADSFAAALAETRTGLAAPVAPPPTAAEEAEFGAGDGLETRVDAGPDRPDAAAAAGAYEPAGPDDTSTDATPAMPEVPAEPAEPGRPAGDDEIATTALPELPPEAGPAAAPRDRDAEPAADAYGTTDFASADYGGTYGTPAERPPGAAEPDEDALFPPAGTEGEAPGTGHGSADERAAAERSPDLDATVGLPGQVAGNAAADAGGRPRQPPREEPRDQVPMSGRDETISSTPAYRAGNEPPPVRPPETLVWGAQDQRDRQGQDRPAPPGQPPGAGQQPPPDRAGYPEYGPSRPAGPYGPAPSTPAYPGGPQAPQGRVYGAAAGGRPGRTAGGLSRRTILVIAGVAVAALVAAVTVVVLFMSAEDEPPPDGWVTVRDATGRLSLRVPPEWKRQPADGWTPADVRLADQGQAPALRATPDLAKFRDVRQSTPGVFAGLSADVTPGKLPPPGLLRPGCAPRPAKPYKAAGLTGSLVVLDCPGGITYQEAGLYDPGRKYAVWVEVKQAGGKDLAPKIMSSLRVRPQ